MCVLYYAFQLGPINKHANLVITREQTYALLWQVSNKEAHYETHLFSVRLLPRVERLACIFSPFPLSLLLLSSFFSCLWGSWVWVLPSGPVVLGDLSQRAKIRVLHSARAQNWLIFTEDFPELWVSVHVKNNPKMCGAIEAATVRDKQLLLSHLCDRLTLHSESPAHIFLAPAGALHVITL